MLAVSVAESIRDQELERPSKLLFGSICDVVGKEQERVVRLLGNDRKFIGRGEDVADEVQRLSGVAHDPGPKWAADMRLILRLAPSLEVLLRDRFQRSR